MSDPAWYDEPYPLDHRITWREHYAAKTEPQARGRQGINKPVQLGGRRYGIERVQGQGVVDDE